MNKFDIFKITGWVIGLGGIATPEIISGILEPFGVSHDGAAHVARILGALVLLATVIANTRKNPSPDAGMVSVVAPKDADPIRVKDLTTAPPPESKGTP